mgnify:CR=1 FL=1
MPSLRSGAGRCFYAAVVARGCCCRGRAFAQAVTGTMSGTVVDPQGQVVPGATVTVVNEATTRHAARRSATRKATS